MVGSVKDAVKPIRLLWDLERPVKNANLRAMIK